MEQNAATSDSPVVSLGQRLCATFANVERERQEYEDRWLANLRLERGIHDPKIQKRLEENPELSQTFLMLMRVKTRTLDARLLDMLFPSGRQKNWDIKPTPHPEPDPVLIEHAKAIAIETYAAAAAEQGIPPEEAVQHIDPEELEKNLKSEIENSCKEMARIIEDQLAEGRYKAKCRNVFHSGHLYGTGVLKGPSAIEDRRIYYQAKKGSTSEFERVEKQTDRPHFEYVRLWDFYPDMSALDIDEAEYTFQRHVLTRAALRKLARREDFDETAIERVITTHPQGNATRKRWEQELKDINEKMDSVDSLRRRYEVLEYTGYLDGRDLSEAGIDIPEEEFSSEFLANVWVCANEVLAANLTPLDEGLGYYLYYYERDENSIFGIGAPEIGEDMQELINASNRLMLDNAAYSVGPQAEVNISLLENPEDANKMHPKKVWIKRGKGAEAQARAVQFHDVPSYLREGMSLIGFYRDLLDEISAIPSYMSGGDEGRGAAETAKGLSMLMGAATLTIKDCVDNFDEGITKPFLRAIYHWNMEYTDSADAKGDYEVIATGATSLMAREIRVEQLQKFASTLQPADEVYYDRGELIREMATLMEIPESVVRDAEETDLINRMKEQINTLTQELQAVMKQLQGAGLLPEARMAA